MFATNKSWEQYYRHRRFTRILTLPQCRRNWRRTFFGRSSWSCPATSTTMWPTSFSYRTRRRLAMLRRGRTRVELGCHGALVATYRCLCEGCTNMAPDIVITWFPLLLQLWSYEWFTIVWQEGNVLAGFVPHDTQEDMPTMGTLWTDRRVIMIIIGQ
jgi:hypothetical protein